MDPNETLLAAFNAICEGDKSDAVETLDDLRRWIEKGGFAPRFPDAPVPLQFIRNLLHMMI
jgi:hypothetical protein